MSCPRKYDFRYNHNLVPKKKADALTFGTLVHEALAVYYRSGCDREKAVSFIIDQHPHFQGEKERMWRVAVAMVSGYADKWLDDGWIIKAVEMPLGGLGPKGYIPRGEKKRAQKGWRYGGVLDLLIEKDKSLWLVEHKTTSSLTGDYLERLWTDTQIALYQHYLSLQRPPIRIAGVIYNVAVKTTIRQRQNEREDDFDARLMEWYREPEVFHREEIFLDKGRIDDALMQLSEGVEMIRHLENRGVFPPNTRQCTNYGKCPYFILCQNKCDDMTRELYFETREANEELAKEIEE
jgi:hypothetical protein